MRVARSSLPQCSAEYKVPGLYVIDSIVRQSKNAVSCVSAVEGQVRQLCNFLS